MHDPLAWQTLRQRPAVSVHTSGVNSAALAGGFPVAVAGETEVGHRDRRLGWSCPTSLATGDHDDRRENATDRAIAEGRRGGFPPRRCRKRTADADGD